MKQFSKNRENNSRGPLIEFWLRVQSFLQIRSNIARAAGLRSREYELLLAVKAVPDSHRASISVLAERLLLQHHVAAGMVKSLAKKGLLVAKRSPHDRRALSIQLTATGERLLREIVAKSLNGLQLEGPRIRMSLKRVIAGPRTSAQFRGQAPPGV